jgi:hypothetical protein
MIARVNWAPMHLVFLYGPPAAGKLTIAKEVSAHTGFRLFHNHLSRDAVTALFPVDTPEFTPTVRRLRLQLIEAAAEAGLPGVIFTFVFYRGEDEPFVDGVCDIVERRGGTVCFVQLACDRATLARRVTEASRRRFGKLVDPEGLSHVLRQHDVFSPIPERASLRLDSVAHGPADNARTIVQHYGLPGIDAQAAG